MPWTRIADLHPGGSGLAALKGRRVRPRADVTTGEFVGAESAIGAPVTIAKGRVGFVGEAVGDGVVLAFPDTPPGPQDRIEWLRWGRFKSIRVDGYNLRHQFEIET